MKRILVVDDEEDILINLKLFLETKGYKVTTTTSCAEAEAIFLSTLPDLVLLDINIGDEDGRVMCRRIKDRAEWKHIPVILISANWPQLEEYKSHGATSFLTKPFNFNALSTTIEQVLVDCSV